MNKGYESVQRWTSKVDLFKFDYIFVPIHLPDHWALSVIFGKSRSIRYYDSLGGQDAGVTWNLEKYLKREHETRKMKPLRIKYNRETVKDSPRQSLTSLDCGIYLMTAAEQISRSIKPAFEQIEMIDYRKKIAFEILKHRLL